MPSLLIGLAPCLDEGIGPIRQQQRDACESPWDALCSQGATYDSHHRAMQRQPLSTTGARRFRRVEPDAIVFDHDLKTIAAAHPNVQMQQTTGISMTPITCRVTHGFACGI